MGELSRFAGIRAPLDKVSSRSRLGAAHAWGAPSRRHALLGANFARAGFVPQGTTVSSSAAEIIEKIMHFSSSEAHGARELGRPQFHRSPPGHFPSGAQEIPLAAGPTRSFSGKRKPDAPDRSGSRRRRCPSENPAAAEIGRCGCDVRGRASGGGRIGTPANYSHAVDGDRRQSRRSLGLGAGIRRRAAQSEADGVAASSTRRIRTKFPGRAEANRAAWPPVTPRSGSRGRGRTCREALGLDLAPRKAHRKTDSPVERGHGSRRPAPTSTGFLQNSPRFPSADTS